MKLEVKGYKNIQNLSYECQDNKVNFLFGISGSGKSSIPEALTDPNPLGNLTFGFTGSQVVLINGQTPASFSVKCFKSDSPELFFGPGADQNIQDILIDDNREYEKALNDLKILLNDLEKAKNSYQSRFEEISEIVRKLGAKNLGKKNQLSSTSPLSKVISAVSKLRDSRNFKEIESMEKGKFPWLLEGAGYIHGDKCPFCSHHLSKKLLKKLSRFQKYEEKNLTVISSQSPSYSAVTGHTFGNNFASLKIMRKDVVELSIACKDFERLDDFIDILYAASSNESMIGKFQYSKAFHKYFVNFILPIKKLNKQIAGLKTTFKKAKKKTSEILKHKTSQINGILTDFAIPYYVSAKYQKNAINDYRLIHKKDSSKGDDGAKLSNGEKFVVSLIFFILQVRKKQPALVVFDDPVSSYDEFRRKQLIDLIVTQLGTQTILLLSHDAVFAKYAVFMRKKGEKRIGNIDYLEHFGNAASFTAIKDSDFVIYSESVIDHIGSISNYYLKIANLRTLYEGKNNGIIYKYLSAILHCTEPSEISALLSEAGAMEQDLLDRIEKDLSLKQELPKVFTDYYKRIDTNGISVFEKGLLLREFMQHHPNIDKRIKKELDEYIHLNSRLHLCLNPYSFPFCTQTIFDNISDNIKGTVDIK